MFGAGRRKVEALEEAIREAEALVATEGEATTPLLVSGATDLRGAIDALLGHEGAEAYADPATSALLDRAERLHVKLATVLQERARRERESAEATRSVALAHRFDLRRCRLCDGGTFLVHEEQAVRTTAFGGLPVVAIVCATCGDVRLRARSPKDVEDHAHKFSRVTLATGGGPFRS